MIKKAITMRPPVKCDVRSKQIVSRAHPYQPESPSNSQMAENGGPERTGSGLLIWLQSCLTACGARARRAVILGHLRV